MRAGYRGAVAFHVRTWLATKQLSTVLSRPGLGDYLASLPELRVFTADLQARRFYFNRVKVSAEGVSWRGSTRPR